MVWPDVAGDAGDRGDADDPAVGVDQLLLEQLGGDPLGRGEVDRDHRGEASSRFMFASRLSRVMPALCTTMSTPPYLLLDVPGDPLRRVLAGDVEGRGGRRRARPSRACSSLAAWGTSMPRTVAPSRCSTRAICSPMPRLAPVTMRDLAGQRRGPVLRPPRPRRSRRARRSGRPGPRRRPTWGRAGTPASRRARRRRAGATYTSWTVPPRPTSLPSERVKPSRARWATRSSARVGRLRRGAEHDDARAAARGCAAAG